MNNKEQKDQPTSNRGNCTNHVIAGSTGKLRPCDCKDSVDTSQLEEQGIGHNDESIMVCPNYVLLTMGHTTVKIGMARFKMFAEWYLGLQG